MKTQQHVRRIKPLVENSDQLPILRLASVHILPA